MSERPRILAIDDSPEILRVVERSLGRHYECEYVADVSAARERLGRERFDLALCHIQLPGELGLIAEEIAAEDPDTALVVITETDAPEAVDQALELGVHGYLVKPLSAGQLSITVQAALRRQALEAVEKDRQRALEEQIQAAVDQAPVPIYVKDLERRYLLANRVTHELAGVEPGQMIGRTDAEVLAPEADLLIRESDMRVLRRQEPTEREERFQSEGRERTFLSVKFPYLDREGKPAGITGVSTEITAQREAEQLQRKVTAAHERAIEELQASRQEAVERLARAIEMRDGETARQVDRMTRIASYLASQLGLGEEQILLLRTAAPMHDIGKVATPEEILRKPGPLTPEERDEMERHTEVGHRLLADSESELLQMAARIALTHHEWFDGNGYPRGLAGEEIPTEGRIVAVADVFDALLSDRPYRPAMSTEEAAAAIRAGRETQFDPEVVDVLLEHLEDALDLHG